MKTIIIELPDQFEFVRTGKGWEIKPVKDVSVQIGKDLTDIDRLCVEKKTGHSMAYIGDDLVPPALRGKCIVLSSNFNWEFTTHEGRHVLIPTRKQKET